MRKSCLILSIFFPLFCYSQTKWFSTRFNYSIEIPQGFTQTTAVGSNVDFKATKQLSSIVIVVKTLPQEFVSYRIWELLGDLQTFGPEWESGAKEYMNNPKFFKYGKTTLGNLETFWFDYSTSNPQLYSKNYQTKKGARLYTITLTCPENEYNYYSSIWFRFKDKFNFE
jgi:hypothetical protein